MKRAHIAELVGLGVLALVLTALTVSGQTTFGAPGAGQAANCSVSFNGQLASLQMAPQGSWSLVSSDCRVTGSDGALTSGQFTGRLASAAFSGVVTGTWTSAGSTETVSASSTTFTLSFEVDQAFNQAPVVGAPIQGTLTGIGSQTLLAVQTAGQVTMN